MEKFNQMQDVIVLGRNSLTWEGGGEFMLPSLPEEVWVVCQQFE